MCSVRRIACGICKYFYQPEKMLRVYDDNDHSSWNICDTCASYLFDVPVQEESSKADER